MIYRYSNIPFVLLPLMFLLKSCDSEISYPDTPVIEFHSFTPEGNNCRIAIDFIDGDGDIGLKENDVNPPFDINSIYFNNLFISYEEKINGQWQPVLDQSLLPAIYKYRIQYITQEGRNKSLKGKIEVLINDYNITLQSDTIRFKIKLIDRALHESNEVITPEIHL